MRANAKHHEVLARAVRGCRSYLEVGVQEGGSLSAVINAGMGVQDLLLCDTWCRLHGGTGRGDHRHIEFMLEELAYEGEATFLDGRSQATLPKYIAQHRGATFDLSHVDGSHDHEDALMDLENVWRLTAKRMVVHDVSFAQVWQAVVRFGDRDDAEAHVTFGDLSSVMFERRKV